MSNILRHLTGTSISNKIFIVGTGRSGTHWLARILARDDNIRPTIEEYPGFGWSKQMAVDPSTRARQYWKLVWYYRLQHLFSVPRHYLDKSHPNLWIADQLANTFDDALFIGIRRNPYATVASMMKHEQVRKWHERWRDLPVPNPFLGITCSDVEHYDHLSIAAQCAKRWKAHADKMSEMQRLLSGKIHVVDHEQLIMDAARTLTGIETFLGLTTSLQVQNIDYQTLDKWRRSLTSDDIQDIFAVTGVDPDSVISAIDV